jgi:hypothetical protein
MADTVWWSTFILLAIALGLNGAMMLRLIAMIHEGRMLKRQVLAALRRLNEAIDNRE